MVKLRNIKKNSTIAECDIFPEDSVQCGHIIVDLKTEEVKEYTLPVEYEWCRKHIYHAADNLIKLVKLKEEEFPAEYLIKWY